MIRRFLVAALFLLAASSAYAQIYPGGASAFTPGHTVRCLNSLCTVVGDAGGAAGSTLNGQGYLTELGITATGTPFCVNDALTSAAGGYHQLCFGAYALGGGLISYNAYNGASPLGLSINLNGTSYPFPGSGNGDVLGPSASGNNNMPLFNGVSGILLKDSGLPIFSVTGNGAACNNAGDDTIAFNNTIGLAAAAGGGLVTVPSGRTCAIAGTVAIPASGVYLIGQGAGATVHCTGTGTGSCVVIGNQTAQVNNTGVQSLTIKVDQRTGGEAIDVTNAGAVLISDVQLPSVWNGIWINRTNDVWLNRFVAQVVRSGVGGFCVQWYTPAPSGYRSDVLQIFQSTCNGQFNGNDGFVWDGPDYSLNMSDTNFIAVNHGILVKNSAESASAFPQEGNFQNVAVDGAMSHALEIDGGWNMVFSGNTVFSNSTGDVGQGNADGAVCLIEADSGASYTRQIKFVGARCENGRQQALLASAQDVLITGSFFSDAGLAGYAYGTWSLSGGVLTAPSATGTILIGDEVFSIPGAATQVGPGTVITSQLSSTTWQTNGTQTVASATMYAGFPAVELGSGCGYCFIANSNLGPMFGNSLTMLYGLEVDAGSTGIVITAPQTYANVLGAIYSAGGTNQIGGTDFDGTSLGVKIGGAGYYPGLYFTKSNPGGTNEGRIDNLGTTNGSAAQVTVSLNGIASAYGLFEETTNGTTPALALSSGVGNTGGMSIATGAGPLDLSGSGLVQVNGHLGFTGSNPTMPTGLCGATTSASVSGVDVSGVITTGTGTVNSCQMNFANSPIAWATAPICTMTPGALGFTWAITAVSTSSVTFSFSASEPGIALYYHCVQG